MKWCFFMTLSLIGSGAVLAQDSPVALQQAFMDAMRANNAEGMAACYSDDAVLYTMSGPRSTGPRTVRRDWSAFFSNYRVLDASLVDTGMETRGDLAVAWGQFLITAEPRGGGDSVQMTGRFTDVAQRIDGRWRYIVDHVSPDPVPGDDGQGQE